MVNKNYKKIELDSKYIPKKSEPYMCPDHLAYFYHILNAQKEELQSESNGVLSAVRLAEKNDSAGVGDDSDSSSLEQEIAMNLRISERNNNLLRKIDAALERLETGKFGYSLISGDEIGLKRMMARPVATVTLEEQEEIERKES